MWKLKGPWLPGEPSQAHPAAASAATASCVTRPVGTPAARGVAPAPAPPHGMCGSCSLVSPAPCPSEEPTHPNRRTGVWAPSPREQQCFSLSGPPSAAPGSLSCPCVPSAAFSRATGARGAAVEWRCSCVLNAPPTQARGAANLPLGPTASGVLPRHCTKRPGRSGALSLRFKQATRVRCCCSWATAVSTAGWGGLP